MQLLILEDIRENLPIIHVFSIIYLSHILLNYWTQQPFHFGFKLVFYTSIGECDTILSAYTKYRHLG